MEIISKLHKELQRANDIVEQLSKECEALDVKICQQTSVNSQIKSKNANLSKELCEAEEELQLLTKEIEKNSLVLSTLETESNCLNLEAEALTKNVVKLALTGYQSKTSKLISRVEEDSTMACVQSQYLKEIKRIGNLISTTSQNIKADANCELHNKQKQLVIINTTRSYCM